MPFRLRNEFNDLDRDFALKLLEIWVTFAKESRLPRLSNGNYWPSADKYNPKLRYVEINGPFLRERKFEFESRCNNFWRQLLPFYKR